MKQWISLNMTPQIEPRAATKLLEKFGSAENVFHARRNELESLRLRPESIESILKREFHDKAEEELAKVKEFGGDVLILDDGSYPCFITRNCRPADYALCQRRLAGVFRFAVRRGRRLTEVFDLRREGFRDVIARFGGEWNLRRFRSGAGN
jgi:hypothetical protein